MVTLDTLTLYDFIKAVTGQVVPDNFDAIMEEYGNLSSNNNRIIFEAQKDVAYLRNKIFLIETIANNWHISLMEELRIMGITGATPEDAIMQGRQLVVELNEQVAELETMRGNETAEITEMDYMVEIMGYGKWYGNIDIHKTTVKEYIAIKKIYKLTDGSRSN